MTRSEKNDLLRRYSNGEITAIDVRRRMDDASYGDILVALAEYDLPLPRAPQRGREQDLQRARDMLFPAA